ARARGFSAHGSPQTRSHLRHGSNSLPGLPSSASQDSKDAKQGNFPALLQLARGRQAALQSYVPPCASPDAIVARLREGEGFAPDAELPAWDFTVRTARCAAALVAVASRFDLPSRRPQAPSTSDAQERPAKRSRLTAAVEDGCPGPARPPAVADPPSSTARGGPTDPPASRGLPAVKLEPATDRATTTGGSGESNSDQATNSQAYLPLSPDDGEGAGGGGAGGRNPAAEPASSVQPRDTSAGGQSSLASSHHPFHPPPPQRHAQPPPLPPAQHQRPPQQHQPAAPELAARVARSGRPCSPAPSLRSAPGDGPSTSGRPASPPPSHDLPCGGVSVQTQTSQRDFPVLPTSFLELPSLGGTALSFNSIGPFDLQLETEQRPGVADGRVDAHIEEARRTKREGDALFSRNGRVWGIKSLSKYVSASLMFMEAAEAMQREPPKRDRQSSHSSQPSQRAAGLYKQTAELLVHTVSFADSVKVNGVGKEALRLLAERLCAVCLMRQALLSLASFKSCAGRAQEALREHSKQQAAQGAGTGGAAGAAAGPQPSPEDSTTSSLHAAPGGPPTSAAAAGAAGGSGGAPAQGLAGFGHEQVTELLSYARTTVRFSEYMRRSSKGFEALLERSDVRSDQQAKLVCMHLAAVCMDMGNAPGQRVIHHAREAVRTLCEDLAR
ncbi:hypothetical protein TSOC_005569, partial [Tetrabaena socialis]